jgi:hypothetical protein
VRERLPIRAQVDDSLSSDNLQTETGFPGSSILDGVEEDGDPVCSLESRVHFVAGEWPDAFTPFDDILIGNGSALVENGRRTSDRGCGEIVSEVEDVGTKDPEIETASSAILFSATANFKHSPDFPVGNQFLQDWENGVIPVAVSNGELRPCLTTGGDDLIGFDQIGDERFLNVDPTGACFCGCDGHGSVLIDMPGGHGNDVRRNFGEHLPIALEGE